MNNAHPTKHVKTITVIDPDTGGAVEVEIRKDTVTGAMVGLDGSVLADEHAPLFDPYNEGDTLIVPDDEEAPRQPGERREVEVTFNVAGYVKQTIVITNPNFNPEQVVKGLQDGTLVTTVQEGGSVDVTATGEEVGRVVHVENECEYTDFEGR